MFADAPHCCAVRPLPASPRWWLGSGVGLGLVAALAPKCPLCFAAYLAVLGLGTTTGLTIAELLAPTSAVLGMALVGVWIVARARR
jgi:hypothetical protein